MKYLVLLRDLDYRGSQRVAQNYSLGMKNRWHEVQVLTLDALGERASLLTNQGIVCRCLATESNALSQVVAWSPDVIHVHRPGIYEYDFNKLLTQLKQETQALILETNIFSRVDYKISPDIVDVHLHLTEWCLWKWSKWSKFLNYQALGLVLPYSVISDSFHVSSLETIQINRQEIGIPKDDIVFGRVGARCEAKWHPIIVNSFKEAYNQKADISLLLVAPPESVCTQIGELPSEVKQKVFIVPPVKGDDQLSLLYSTMDVMLHASRIGESFGMVLAESLLCETPVITLSTPEKDNSQVELIEHNRTGKVVNSEDAFIKAMLEMASSSSKRAEFGKTGCLQMQNRFENELVCAKLEKLCELMLSSQAKSRNTILEILKAEGFTTSAENHSIVDILEAFDGQISAFTKLKIQLVHHPWLYYVYANCFLPVKTMQY